MKFKEKVIVFIFCALVISLYLVIGSYNVIDNNIKKLYKVYLDGEVLGAISNRNDLYNLIDRKQQAIKDKYKVNSVYPPKGLEVIETYSYVEEESNLEDVYNKIENLQDFTIYGYEVKISKTEEHDEFSIYVLDKEIFRSAVEKFILAFIEEEGYYNYVNDSQEELDDIGMIYDNLGFLEEITIREKYISINDKIYESSDELVQDLLFGFNYQEHNYIVKSGDTIESVAEAYELNPQEILIANTKYSSKDSLLTIGDKLKIAYVIPEISFTYTVNEMEEVEYDYDNEIVRDNTKQSNYSEITTPGVKGISLITSQYTVVNGELASEVEIIKDIVIREKVNQITTKGKKSYSSNWEVFKETGAGWTWPTEPRYIVTSEYGYRSLGGGKQHNGIDISGTGWGSKIYAANEGVVTYVFSGCANDGYYGNPCGSGYGNQVVIDHGNNIYTIYAHIMNDITVSVGQSVSKGQIIGYMADSGSSTGTHLHFAVSMGDPKRSAIYYNPRKLYQ